MNLDIPIKHNQIMNWLHRKTDICKYTFSEANPSMMVIIGGGIAGLFIFINCAIIFAFCIKKFQKRNQH